MKVKVKKMECPSCTAPVKIRVGEADQYCEYCGSKLTIEGVNDKPIQQITKHQPKEITTETSRSNLKEENEKRRLDLEEKRRGEIKNTVTKEFNAWKKWRDLLKYFYITLGVIMILAFLSSNSGLIGLWGMLFFFGPIVLAAMRPAYSFYDPKSFYSKGGKFRCYLRICLAVWGIIVLIALIAGFILALIH